MVSVVACARQSPPPPAPEPQVVRADFYVESEPVEPGERGEPGVARVAPPGQDPVKTRRDQPPDVKLLLGHYSNDRRGIGAVIDRTQKEAKLRYDGTTEIIKLYPQPGMRGRTDYYRNARYVGMHVWDDGRVVVYLPSANEGIPLFRDADADPL